MEYKGTSGLLLPLCALLLLQAAQAEIATNAGQLQEALERQAEDASRWPRYAGPLPRTALPGSSWPAEAQAVGLAASLAAAAPLGPRDQGQGQGQAEGRQGGRAPQGAQQQRRQQGQVRPAPPKPVVGTRLASNTVGGKTQPLQVGPGLALLCR